MKDGVVFREFGSIDTFAVEKTVLRQAMRDLRPLMTKDEQGFVENAIRKGLPNPVVVNQRATDAIKDICRVAEAA